MTLDSNFELVKKLVDEGRERGKTNRELALRDEFLAFVGHELRTPLNAITGWARVIAEGVDDATLDKAIAVILRNAEAQERIISDLYDAARISSGKFTLNLKFLNLSKTVAEAVEAVLPVAADKKVDLKQHTADENLTVWADEGRLRQVICNLLNNAVKFTPAKGFVNIWCGIENSSAHIAVSDTGCGIEPEILPRIFDRSFQAENRAGLGFGLTIAKYIIEQHNGTISAESGGVNQGATFTVRLPVGEFF